MGEVARHGIALGQRVPAAKLLPKEGVTTEAFVERCLKELGCAEMVRPLLNGDLLTPDQVLFLLQDAPTSALTKLVEVLLGVSETPQLPRPMVMLPLESWVRTTSVSEASDTAFRFLRAVPFAEIDVALDWFDFEQFEWLLELVEELSRRRPGVRFIGPSIEEIVAFLAQDEDARGGTLSDLGGRLDDCLFSLRKAGFYRLRFSVDLETMKALEVPERMRSAGLIGVLGVPIDRPFVEAARDLVGLAMQSESTSDWDVWLPSVNHQFDGIAVKDAVVDVRILRMLSVGALCLRHIPVRRASSSFLSLDGLAMSRYFGANDLGYGALDDATCASLKLLPYRTLMGAFSR